MIRRLLAFAVALALGYVLAAMAATQFVLAQIVALGLPVPLLTRLKMTGQDIVGMSSLYLPIMATGLLLAFLVTGLLIRFAGRKRRTMLYTLAGATALVAANLIMNAVFAITPIAGARSLWGLAAQGVAGAAAGYGFAIFSARGPASTGQTTSDSSSVTTT